MTGSLIHDVSRRDIVCSSMALSESERGSHRYDAFISYRHVEPDRAWAKWLHTALETYRVPKELVAKGVPARLTRVFRDEEELPANADLSSAIVQCLADSRFLIVVCSPRTPASKWVNAEVDEFRRLGRHDRILALLVEGEPGESFPKALIEIRRSVTDVTGAMREQIEDVEPLAADVRRMRADEHFATLKAHARLRIIACILGCRFDDLRRREQERRARRLRMVAASVAVGVLSLSMLGGLAIWQRSQAVEAGVRATQAQTVAKAATIARRRQAYFADLRDAPAMWRGSRIDELRDVLARYEGPEYAGLRSFEWHYWMGMLRERTGMLLEPAGSGTNYVAFDNSGRRLIAVDREGAFKAWNVSDYAVEAPPDFPVMLAERRAQFQARAAEEAKNPSPQARAEARQRARQRAAAPTPPMPSRKVDFPEIFASIHPIGTGDDCVLGPPFTPWAPTALLVGSTDWSFQTGMELAPFTTCIAASDDGTLLFHADSDAHIYERHLPSGMAPVRSDPDITRGYRDSLRGKSIDIEHGAVTAMAVSPDAKFLAVGYENGVVQVWGLALPTMSSTPRIVTHGAKPHTGMVLGIAFSPDGRMVASQSLGIQDQFVYGASGFRPGELMIWQRSTGSEVWSTRPHARKLPQPPGRPSEKARFVTGRICPTFSPDGQRVYSTGDRGIHVWDAQSGSGLGVLPGSDGAAMGVAVSRDGRRMAGIGADGSLRVWESADAATGRDVGEAALAVRKLGVSSDSCRVAVIVDRGEHTLSGNPYLGKSPKWVRSGEDAVRIFDVASGKAIIKVASGSARLGFGPPTDGPFRVQGHESSVNKYDLFDPKVMQFDPEYRSPDGRVEIKVMSNKLEMSWPETDRPAVQLEGHQPWPSAEGEDQRSPYDLPRSGDPSAKMLTAAVFSPDSRFLATGDGAGVLRVWSTSNGELLSSAPTAHVRGVTAITWNREATLLASGGMDRSCTVWAWPKMEYRVRLTGHRREVSGLAFLPGDKRLASSSGHPEVAGKDPGEVILWELEGGQQCLQLILPRPAAFADVAVTPDGLTILAAANFLDGQDEGRVVAWTCGSATGSRGESK